MKHSMSSYTNVSKVVDPDVTWQQRVNPVPLRNVGSTTAAAVHTTLTETSVSESSGIVPALIAAALFVTLLLSLYAVLWKCMVSPPQRKRSKLRVRLQPMDTV